MTENVASLHRNFDVQTGLVAEITSLIRLELFNEAHTLPGAAPALALCPRMALLVNSFCPIFDDTAITHANLRALVLQLGAISFISSQELAPHHAHERKDRSL